MAGDQVKHTLANIISDFTTDESDAPFVFDIESRNRINDCLVIVRVTEKRKRTACMKSAFIVKTSRHLEIFRSYLEFLSSNTFQQKFLH